MKKLILGIDTSNYTTSVALLTMDGELVANLKSPLPVKDGECGLRQSDAVFHHVKNLPQLMKTVREYLKDGEIVCVGVSSRPRNIEGSYMPCFLAGVSAAESAAAVTGAPLYKFSHQSGHVMSAIYSAGAEKLLDSDFAAFHISGGTTELVRVSFNGSDFNTELIGGTADLNAGQVVDRIGVHLGLLFPAGRYLEELALMNTKKVPTRKPKITDFKINLSGLENMAKKLYSETGDKSLTAAFVLDYIERGISLLCDSYQEKFGKCPVAFAGGVMSNSIIRKKLESKFEAYFAEPALSADNAVGIACLARRSYIMRNA